MEYRTLNTGARIPTVGFGVFQIHDLEECKRVVLDAIRVGYRSFDTAASYMNEEALGAAVKEAIDAGNFRFMKLECYPTAFGSF